jgi:hypothetical protein
MEGVGDANLLWIELCVVGCFGQVSCGTRFWTNQRATRFSTLQPARPDQRPGRMETRVRYQQLTEAVPLWSDSGNSLKGEEKSIGLLSPLPAEISFISRWNESPPRILCRDSQLVTTLNHEKTAGDCAISDTHLDEWSLPEGWIRRRCQIGVALFSMQLC